MNRWLWLVLAVLIIGAVLVWWGVKFYGSPSFTPGEALPPTPPSAADLMSLVQRSQLEVGSSSPSRAELLNLLQ